MTSEIEVDGKKYVTSKIAAKEVGYSQDYVGQLARGGEIMAERSGGLWYVNLESLRTHKAHAREDEEKPSVKREKKTDTDSVVTFDAKEFISSKRAAKITGYSQDYVTQLARSGKILSRRISNRWYVYKDQLIEHKNHNDALLASVQAESVGLTKTPTQNAERDYSSDPELTYFTDNKDLAPLIPVKDKDSKEETSDSSQQKGVGVAKENVSHNIPIRIDKKSSSGLQNEPVTTLSSTHVLDLDEILKEEPEVQKRRLLLPATASIAVLLLFGVGASMFLSSNTEFTRSAPSSVTAVVTDTGQTAAAIASAIGKHITNLLGGEIHYRR